MAMLLETVVACSDNDIDATFVNLGEEAEELMCRTFSQPWAHIPLLYGSTVDGRRFKWLFEGERNEAKRLVEKRIFLLESTIFNRTDSKSNDAVELLKP